MNTLQLTVLLALALTAPAQAFWLDGVDITPGVPPQFYIGNARVVFVPPRLLVGEVEATLPEVGLSRMVRTKFPGARLDGDVVMVDLPDGRTVTIGRLDSAPGSDPDGMVHGVVLAPGVSVEGGHGGVSLEIADPLPVRVFGSR